MTPLTTPIFDFDLGHLRALTPPLTTPTPTPLLVKTTLFDHFINSHNYFLGKIWILLGES